MSANPSRNTLLDVLPGFSEEEEVTGIHTRPTISMPPYPGAPLQISSSISALIAESEAEESIEDVTDAAISFASVPPPAEEPIFSLRKKPAEEAAAAKKKPAKSSVSRLARVAFMIATTGFGIGFFFTSPAPAPADRAAAEPAPASAPAAIVEDVAGVPSFSIGPAAAAPMAAPAAAPAPAPAPETAAAAAAKPMPTLADGDWMLRKGDLARAEAIYQSLLARGGADHEALTGLGKVAAARHQTNDALAFFERALARQPEYFPARLGAADALWDAGRTDIAKARYAFIRERYSPSMVPERAIERTR
jgi:tetratricopeptide (TPR) repeat protein